jgi:hypothetical protein
MGKPSHSGLTNREYKKGDIAICPGGVAFHGLVRKEQVNT